MKKFTLIMAVVALFTTAAIAQENRFSVGAELALPMADFADAAGIGFGGSLRYEIPLGENLGVMLTAGYLTFTEKEDGFPTWSMIPIQAGLKYYFMESQNGFYGDVETGVHISSIDVEGAESTTDFGVAPGIGYHLDNLDLGLKYQILFTEDVSMSYLGVRIAYVFGER